MYKWRVQCRFELKFLFRNKFLLLLPLVYGVLMGYSLLNVQWHRPDHLLVNVHDFNKLAHTMLLGIVMLMGMLTIRRDVQSTSFEWIHSWPKSIEMTVVTKYLALLFYFSCITIIMSIVYAGVASFDHQLAFADYYQYLLHDIFSYQISFAITIALAMFLAVVIRHRIVYLIGFCAWMFGTYFMDIFLIDRFQLHFLKTFHLNQYTLNTLLANEVWGIHLFWKEIWLSRLFVIGFTFMLLMVMVMLLNQRRASSTQVKWNWISSISVIVAFILLLPYSFDFTKKSEVFSMINEDAYLYNESNYSEEIYQEFSIKSYEIQVDRKQDNTLLGKADWLIEDQEIAGLENIHFRINPILSVKNIMVNQQSVAYDQVGSLVTFVNDHASNEEFQHISIDYEGEMNIVSNRWINHGDNLFSFADKENVYLNAAMGWYPIPGDKPMFTTFDDRVFLNYTSGNGRQNGLGQSSFKVTLNNFSENVYGTVQTVEKNDGKQVLYSDSTTGVTLYGGNFVEVFPEKQPSVVVNPFNEKGVSGLLEDVEAVTDYYYELFSRPSPLKAHLLFIPNAGFGFRLYDAEIQDDSLLIPIEQMNQYMREREDIRRFSLMRVISYYTLFRDFHFPNSAYGESLAPALEHSFYFLYLKDALKLEDDDFKSAASEATYHFYMSEVNDEFDQYQEWGWTREEYDRHLDMEQTSNQAGRMVLDALEEGKIKEVKQFLVEMYTTFVIPQQELNLYQPEITKENWHDTWNKVMNDE